MAETMKSGPFSPYVNSLNEKDPMVRKVPMDRMGIAANEASMPSRADVTSGVGSIEHVGNGVKRS